MNKITLLYVLVIGLILANIYFVFQQAQRGPGGLMRGDFKKEVIKELKFDKLQSESFELLAKAHHERILALEDSILAAKEAYYLNTLHKADTLQAKKDLNLILELHRSMEAVNVAHFKDLRALCKGEQLNEFDRMIPRFAKFFRRNPPPPHPHP